MDRTKIADSRTLFLRAQFGLDHVKVQGGSQSPGRGPDITGQHHQVLSSLCTQLLQRLKGIFAQGIRDHDMPAISPVNRDMNCRPAFGGHLVPDLMILEKSGVAHVDLML